MNIITIADIEKFITLTKAGIASGKGREMRIYTAASDIINGTNVPQNYFISLEFRFTLTADTVDKIFATQDPDIDSKVKDLLKDI